MSELNKIDGCVRLLCIFAHVKGLCKRDTLSRSVQASMLEY